MHARSRVPPLVHAANSAGLLAHLAEESEQPIGFTLAAAAEEAVDYER